MANKKAAIDLPVRFIVIVIIVLVIMLLLIFFMKTYIEKSRIKLEEQMVVGAPKPYVEITSPEDYEVFEVGDEISFKSLVYTYTSKTKIVGYFWDFNSDGYIDKREENPEYIYYEPGDYDVTLKALNDLGGIGSDSIIVRIFTKNKKNLNKYGGNPTFFIPSSMNSDPQTKVDNWREILKVIPLTRWYDRNGDHKYDYIAIAKAEGKTIDSADIEERLDSIGKKSGITFDMGAISHGPEYNISNEQSNNLTNYFSYWNEYNSVVLVDYNNFEGALIAALFAAYYNSPLMFIEDRGINGNYSDYDTYLLEKKFYVIDNISNSASEYYISRGRISDWTPYDSTELRNPSRRINRIVELESKLFVKD